MTDAFDQIEAQLMQAARRTRRSRAPLSAIVLGTAVAVAASAGAIAAITGSTRPRPSFSAQNAAGFTQAKSAFGVFNLAPTPSGATIAQALNTTVGNAVDPSSVRLARTDSKISMYALAGGESVCLAQRSTNGTQTDCSLLADLSGGKRVMLGVADLGSGTYRLSGMIADGTMGMTVETSAGNQAVSVVNNVIAATVSGAPTQLDWTAPDGSQQHQNLKTAQ